MAAPEAVEAEEKDEDEEHDINSQHFSQSLLLPLPSLFRRLWALLTPLLTPASVSRGGLTLLINLLRQKIHLPKDPYALLFGHFRLPVAARLRKGRCISHIRSMQMYIIRSST